MTAITEAMPEHLAALVESVRVWITEFPATDLMAGGEVLADRQARRERDPADDMGQS